MQADKDGEEEEKQEIQRGDSFAPVLPLGAHSPQHAVFSLRSQAFTPSEGKNLLPFRGANGGIGGDLVILFSSEDDRHPPPKIATHYPLLLPPIIACPPPTAMSMAREDDGGAAEENWGQTVVLSRRIRGILRGYPEVRLCVSETDFRATIAWCEKGCVVRRGTLPVSGYTLDAFSLHGGHPVRMFGPARAAAIG